MRSGRLSPVIGSFYTLKPSDDICKYLGAAFLGLVKQLVTGALVHFELNALTARTALAKWDLPMAEFDRSFRANASALFLLTRLAAETMKASGGSIINIGSYMGVCGLDNANYTGIGMQTDGIEWPSPAYHYEKGGMLNFTRWAASVLGKYDIRVNCVTLIGLETLDGNRTVFHHQHAARTLLNRCCGNEDLKGGIVYLASGASGFVTGTNLVIDGGYTAI